MRRLAALLGAAAVALLAPNAAMAMSNGQITNAVATTDWSHAGFQVSVSGGFCGTGYCSWRAVVLAQPSLPSYACEREEFFDQDANTQVVWNGPEETTNVSFAETATNVALIPHVTGQRLCLEVIGTAYAAWAGENLTFGEYLWSIVPTVEVPPLPTSAPASPVPVAPSEACVKGEAAVVGAWQRVTKARNALQRAKRKHRPAEIKRQAWERDKHEAQQTERQQHELCD